MVLGRMPIFLGWIIDLARANKSINCINSAIGLHVQLLCLVHFDAPFPLSDTLARLFHDNKKLIEVERINC